MIMKCLTAMTLWVSLIPAAALAREAPLPVKLDVSLGGIKEGGIIPGKLAFCVPDGKGRTKPGGDINPSVRWSGAPAETKSYVLLVVDRDVPANFALANKPGQTIPREAKRRDFYHWVMTDIPANIHKIPQGKNSNTLVDGGKPVGKTTYGTNGRNDYASFMKGSYGGYDGPCPPWNDARLHRYHFIVYALDVESLGLEGAFTGPDVVKALDGHVVGKGETYATYATNPALRK